MVQLIFSILLQHHISKRAEYLDTIQSVFTCSNRPCVSVVFRVVFTGLRTLSRYAPERSFERPSRHHFSWFSSVCTRILRLFPGFRVAAVCFSYSPPHLNSPNLNCLLYSLSICGNKMPTKCNRWFLYCRSYCVLNMLRAPLCPPSGAQEYYTGGCCLCSTPDRQLENQSTKYHRQQPPV